MSWKNIGSRNRTNSHGIVRAPETSHEIVNISSVLGISGSVIDVKSKLKLDGGIDDLDSVNYWKKNSSNDVYYNNGNVAIGKDSATSNISLDVSGKIQLYGEYNDIKLSKSNIDFFNYIDRRLTISSISLGSEHGMLLFENGKVYGVGSNFKGQLGLGNNSTGVNSFQQITLLGDLVISGCFSGDDNTFFVTNTGKVYGTGSNDKGHLGIGNNTDVNTPQLVSDISNLVIDKVSAGYKHSLFLASDGKVYSCGSNDYGELGLGNDISFNTPQLISDISNLTITSVSAGSYFSLFLTNDGKVYSCGNNSSGQLGLGNNTNFNTPQLITDSSNVTAIATGPDYAFLLTNTKNIYGFGLNNDSGTPSYSHRLGLGTNDTSYNTLQLLDISNVDQIVVGPTYSLLLVNSDVYVFGQNTGGIGNSTSMTGSFLSSKPSKITENISTKSFKLIAVSRFQEENGFSYMLSIDNLLYVFGANYNYQLTLNTNRQLSSVSINYPNIQIIDQLSNASIKLEDNSNNTLDLSGGLNVDGNVDVSGGLNVDGNVDVSGGLNVDGNVQIDGQILGNGCTTTTASGIACGTFNSKQDGLLVVGNGTSSGARSDALTLDHSGNLVIQGDLTAFSTSDIRLKKNLTKIKDPLDKLGKINGYLYDWIEDGNTHHRGRDVGVVAQEIEEILPELTITRDNGYKAVKYDKIVALLIECVKEQQKQIDALKQGQ